MTKDEIKKALEICADINLNCNDCPYDAVGNCTDTLCADALNLIAEQEKEIERLRDDYARVQEPFAQYQMASDKEIKAQIKQAQIDVLNKLRRRSWQGYQIGMYIVSTQEIDELIKEVQNEN